MIILSPDLYQMVTAAAAAARLRDEQAAQRAGRGADAAAEAAVGRGPRCDLVEWVEDMSTAEAILERLGLLPPADGAA